MHLLCPSPSDSPQWGAHVNPRRSLVLALPGGPSPAVFRPAPLTGIKRTFIYPPVLFCLVPAWSLQRPPSTRFPAGGLVWPVHWGPGERPRSWQPGRAPLLEAGGSASFPGAAPEQSVRVAPTAAEPSAVFLSQFSSDSVTSASWFPQPAVAAAPRGAASVMSQASLFPVPLLLRLPPGFPHFLLVSRCSHGVCGVFASGTCPVRPGL